jgi:hypothetical protein
MNVRVAVTGLLVALLAAAGFAVFAAEDGELWETTIQMPGMPAGMAGMTQRSCRAREERAAPPGQDPKCSFNITTQTATHLVWTGTCPGNPPTTMSGDITYEQNRQSMKGTMRSTSGGQEMVMNMSGRRIGTCDAVAAKKEQDAKFAALKSRAEEGQRVGAKAMADYDQGVAKGCNDAVSSMDPGSLNQHALACKSGRSAQSCKSYEATTTSATRSVCDAKAAEFCQKYRTIEGYAQAGRKRDLDSAGQFCGEPPASVAARLCPSALERDNVTFVGNYCPAQAKVMFERTCAGRDFTSMDRKYSGFCIAYAQGKRQMDEDREEADEARRRATDESRPAPAAAKQAAAKAQESVGIPGTPLQVPTDTINEGIKALKGLFGR